MNVGSQIDEIGLLGFALVTEVKRERETRVLRFPLTFVLPRRKLINCHQRGTLSLVLINACLPRDALTCTKNVSKRFLQMRLRNPKRGRVHPTIGSSSSPPLLNFFFCQGKR